MLGFLEWQRVIFASKCAGLDATGLATKVGPSAMTLGELLKHWASSEDWWFCHQVAGRDTAAWWTEVDWGADPEWEWRSAADDPPEYLRALWSDSVERSRAVLADALEAGGLDGKVRRPPAGVQPASLRWVLMHVIEGYARHDGHADLLREAADGSTGV